MLDADNYVKIIDNTHKSQGPGVVYNSSNKTKNNRSSFFKAGDSVLINHEKHSNKFKTNDTSTTVSFFPLSTLESCILSIEETLNSPNYKKLDREFVGSDIKVMGIRNNNSVEITACIPIISKYVSSLNDYEEKLSSVRRDILNIINNFYPDDNVHLFLNTRDRYDEDDIYMTLTGSAIESGDEGAVGRGNRSRGVIPFTRGFSMEAPAGKNPVYHTGKLFTAIGDIISENIFHQTGIHNYVYMTSRMGDDITSPWSITVDTVDYHPTVSEIAVD